MDCNKSGSKLLKSQNIQKYDINGIIPSSYVPVLAVSAERSAKQVIAKKHTNQQVFTQKAKTK